jgi:hypothetical protein
MLAAEMLVVGPEENSLRNLHLVPQGTSTSLLLVS